MPKIKDEPGAAIKVEKDNEVEGIEIMAELNFTVRVLKTRLTCCTALRLHAGIKLVKDVDVEKVEFAP
ncbi:hypothetical protein M8J75_011405 [Diaphorina citri]|nr:hypothetical protein M8J75_011405 [Diaphorina citri]